MATPKSERSDVGTHPIDLVLVAYDGSDNAKLAISYVARFLRSSRVAVVSVWAPLAIQTAQLSTMWGGMTTAGWATDESAADNYAVTEAKRVAEEGAEIARAAGLDAAPACTRPRERCGRASSTRPTSCRPISSSRARADCTGSGRCCTRACPAASCTTPRDRCSSCRPRPSSVPSNGYQLVSTRCTMPSASTA